MKPLDAVKKSKKSDKKSKNSREIEKTNEMHLVKSREIQSRVRVLMHDIDPSFSPEEGMSRPPLRRSWYDAVINHPLIILVILDLALTFALSKAWGILYQLFDGREGN